MKHLSIALVIALAACTKAPAPVMELSDPHRLSAKDCEATPETPVPICRIKEDGEIACHCEAEPH